MGGEKGVHVWKAGMRTAQNGRNGLMISKSHAACRRVYLCATEISPEGFDKRHLTSIGISARGFLEKVYERSLVNRLHRAGLDVESQIAIPVHDEDGSIVGDFVADLLIERAVIVEVKAVGEIAAEHRAQVLNYLKATGVRVGMLVNFGRTRLQLKRFAL